VRTGRLLPPVPVVEEAELPGRLQAEAEAAESPIRGQEAEAGPRRPEGAAAAWPRAAVVGRTGSRRVRIPGRTSLLLLNSDGPSIAH
jgi:hypothetical protein